MHLRLGVFNSDRPNRHHIVFPLCALADALEQRWVTGTPNYVGHDRHRLVGWSHPLGIHLQGGLARLTGICLLPETPNEQAALATKAEGFIEAMIEEHVGPHVENLRARLGEHLTADCRWIEAGCAAVVDSGIATRVFPDIFSLQDKDGLIPISRLNQVEPGVFEAGGLLLFAHRFLRRSLSRHNTLNSAFLARFSELPGELKPRIALDEDMIGLASTLTGIIELEFWWGPKFDSDLAKIPTGITRHEATDSERLFHGISWTEFWWYELNGRRTFEAEEVVDRPSKGIDRATFGCRFVHSILDGDSELPSHLDGAVRVYDEDRMLTRLDCNIYEAGRHADYHKLWRIDGDVAVESWKEVICHYFRDNHLVGEYFGAAPPSEEEKATVIDLDANPLDLFVPYNLRPGDGLQLHVSFHEKKHEALGRSVRVFDVLKRDNHELWFVDTGITEIRKLLARRGEQLAIPPETNRIAFEDMVINLPVVAHTGPDAVALAETTLSVIAELCEHLAARAQDRLLSFSIAVELPDRELLLSCAAHLQDLLAWFRGGPHPLPRHAADSLPWLEHAYARLNELFPGEHPTRLLHGLLQPSGMLVFVRRFLMPGTYNVAWDESRQALMIHLAVPKDSPEVPLLQSGELQVASAHLVRRSRCTKCNQSYLECPCCKFVDDGVGQEMEEAPCVAAFWTNRKA